MLYILANPKSFARKGELLLNGFVRGDETRWVVRSVEIPRVKAGKILESSEEFVPADYQEEVSL